MRCFRKENDWRRASWILRIVFKINSYCTARSHVSRLSRVSLNKKNKAVTQGHKNNIAKMLKE
jgi:hypothetical protein